MMKEPGIAGRLQADAGLVKAQEFAVDVNEIDDRERPRCCSARCVSLPHSALSISLRLTDGDTEYSLGDPVTLLLLVRSSATVHRQTLFTKSIDAQVPRHGFP